MQRLLRPIGVEDNEILDHEPGEDNGRVLCDATTAQAAKDQMDFDPLPAITVKGKAAPVVVYRPRGEAQPRARQKPPHTAIIGRQAKRRLLAEQLQRLRQDGTGSLVIIEGEAGIGKSKLVEDLIEGARVSGVSSVMGVGDAIEKSTPYYAWRPVFSQVFNLSALPDDHEIQKRHILNHLQSEPELSDLAPLLNAALPLELPDNEITEFIAEKERADKTRDLLVRLLQAYTDQTLTLLILEDAHWLDSASWAFAHSVSQNVPQVLFVIVTRPLTEPLPTEYRQLLNTPHTKLVLDTLSAPETLSLVCQRLGVDTLPESVTALIRSKAEGHPFFSEELAYALRDAGTIVIVDGECRVTPDTDDLDALNLPDTVQGVITSRIDRLTPRQQLLLKVASVIGRIFPFPLLRDVYPIVTDRKLLNQMLDALGQLDITLLETPPPNLSYIFKHIITQDVAYNLMLYAQRQMLHRAIAEWYEVTHQVELTGYFPILAHHWTLAAGENREDKKAVAKAKDYLEKSGELALRNGAFPEAIAFLQQALDWYESLPESDKELEQELKLLKILGTATFTTSGYGSEETRNVYDRAWKLCQEIGDTPEVFPVLWGVWLCYHFSSETDTEIELGEQLMALAQKSGDKEFLLQAHHALWTTFTLIPDYEKSQRHLEAGRKLYRPEMHQSHCFHYGGHDPGMYCHRALCLTNWAMGYPDRAVQAGSESIQCAQSHHFSLLIAHLAAAFVHKQRGGIKQTQEQAERIAAVANTSGLQGFALWAAIYQGWVLGQTDQVEKGISVTVSKSPIF